MPLRVLAADLQIDIWYHYDKESNTRKLVSLISDFSSTHEEANRELLLLVTNSDRKESFVKTGQKKNVTVAARQSTREILLSVTAELLCPPDNTAGTVRSVSPH